jgi:hypothetical protein
MEGFEMNLVIGPFTIVSDSSQFTIYRKNSFKDKKTGEIKVADTFCGHYSTLDSCLKDGIIRHGLLQSDCLTLTEVLEEIQNYKKWVTDILDLPKPAVKISGNLVRSKNGVKRPPKF